MTLHPQSQRLDTVLLASSHLVHGADLLEFPLLDELLLDNVQRADDLAAGQRHGFARRQAAVCLHAEVKVGEEGVRDLCGMSDGCLRSWDEGDG